MANNLDSYPWEVRSDANTLLNAREILSDPVRSAKAKEYAAKASEEYGALASGKDKLHTNPATICKL